MLNLSEMCIFLDSENISNLFMNWLRMASSDIEAYIIIIAIVIISIPFVVYWLRGFKHR